MDGYTATDREKYRMGVIDTIRVKDEGRQTRTESKQRAQTVAPCSLAVSNETFNVQEI